MKKKIRCGGCMEWFHFEESLYCSDDCAKKIFNERQKKVDEFRKKPTHKIDHEKGNNLLIARRKKGNKTAPPYPKKRKRRSKNQIIARLENRIKQQKAALKKMKRNHPKFREKCFYDSNQWRRLRYKVLTFYGRKCMCCGAMEGQMHVDHIKPRSRFPHLQYDFENLQILCADCNLGKSNDDCIDYRKKKQCMTNQSK